jgi:TolB-like protein/DNA-binding winged helix-turn-helix (wHTH) protein/lipoprotein NlpI
MYQFASFSLDPLERVVSRNGTPLTLTPKVFDTLLCLVRNPGRVLTKDELLKEIWPDTFVEEVNLAVNISTLRKALGENPQECRYIATVPGRGYRFVAQVREVGNGDKSERGVVLDGRSVPRTADLPWSKQKFEGAAILKFVLPALLVFFLVAAVGWHLWFRKERTKAAAATADSIAVLPFADLSPGGDQEYFSDGLTEELINDLAKVSGLKVVARSSAFQFKGKNEDPRSVGRKLGVSNILEGSVRREGDRVRISAELTNAKDGFQLWSQTYDHKVDDVFAVQDEIAAAVSDALQVKLVGANGSPVSTSNHRTSAEAYQAYLRGQYFLGRGEGKSDLDKALSYANQAIKLDAQYAPAWVLRSYSYNLMAGFGLMDNTVGMSKAREDAQRAIALDPTLASAYEALGDIELSYDWDWSGAEGSGKRAADLAPGSAAVLRFQSSLYEVLGRTQESIEVQERAIAADPLRARSYTALASTLYELGQYQEAQTAIQKALELNPQKEHDHAISGEILLAQGRPQQALAEMDDDPRKFWRQLGEALAYHALGRARDSEAALTEIIATDQNGAAFQIAEVYAYRGESDKAFAWLDRAYRQRDGGLTYVKVDPLLKSLRRDQRYAALLNKMHLPI